MPSNRKDFLLSLADVFGAQPSISVDGRPRAHSNCGLCVTFFVIFGILMASGFLFAELLRREVLNVVTSRLKIDNPDTIRLGEDIKVALFAYNLVTN